MSLNHGVKEFSGNRSVKGVIGHVLRPQILTGVLKHILELLLAHVLVVPNLVQVRGDIDIRSEEQNVVDWAGRSAQTTRGVHCQQTFVFTPGTI